MSSNRLIDAVKNSTQTIADISTLFQPERKASAKEFKLDFDVNQLDKTGHTALHHATFREDGVECAQLLLGHGADPTAMTKSEINYSLMQVAAIHGNAKIISFLLEQFPFQCFEMPIGTNDVKDYININEQLSPEQRIEFCQRIELINHLLNPTANFSHAVLRAFYTKNPANYMNTVTALLRNPIVKKENLLTCLKIGIQHQINHDSMDAKEQKRHFTYRFDARTDHADVIHYYLEYGGNPEKIHLLEIFQNKSKAFFEFINTAITSTNCISSHSDTISEILLHALQLTQVSHLKDRIHLYFTKLFHYLHLYHQTDKPRYEALEALEWGCIADPKNLTKEENDFLVKNILFQHTDFLSPMNIYQRNLRIHKHLVVAEEKPELTPEQLTETLNQHTQLIGMGWHRLDQCMMQLLKHILKTNSLVRHDRIKEIETDTLDLFQQLSRLKKHAETYSSSRGMNISMFCAVINKTLNQEHTPTLFNTLKFDSVTNSLLKELLKHLEGVQNKVVAVKYKALR